MAGRPEKLVTAIRAQRRRVRAATDAALTDSEIPRRIRRSPFLWLGGAALVGAVTGRLVVPPLVRAGRRHLAESVRQELRERIRAALTTVVAAAASRFAAGANGDGRPASPPASISPDDAGSEASHPDLSARRSTS